MTAASRLVGLTLDQGWTVYQRLERPQDSSGGTFSHSYLARRGDQIAFVKAFDFSAAFEPNVDTMSILKQLTTSYDHERDVLEHCRGRHISNVAIAIGHGSVVVPTMDSMQGRVFYLLFERAEGDIRCQMNSLYSQDAVWCITALRQVCLGLWQVHRELIAHQDIKPSNILHYGGTDIRISDFGRSSRRGHSIWYDEHNVAGDMAYAPPELLYGYLDPDFIKRRIGTDLYMLANLAIFLFTGVNLTESILSRLDPQHHYMNSTAQYQTVLPYLQESFGRVLEDISAELPRPLTESIIPFVMQLGNPDLAKRGYPKNVGTRAQYSLEPYVGKLTSMVIEVQIQVRLGKIRP